MAPANTAPQSEASVLDPRIPTWSKAHTDTFDSCDTTTTRCQTASLRLIVWYEAAVSRVAKPAPTMPATAPVCRHASAEPTSTTVTSTHSVVALAVMELPATAAPLAAPRTPTNERVVEVT